MVVADAVLRKLPGALGHAESAVEESFSEALGGAPEYPHYTRPASYRGWGVPEVLLSGDHERVREWRRQRSGSRERAIRRLLARRLAGSCLLSDAARAAGPALFPGHRGSNPPSRRHMSTIIESIEQRQLKKVPRFDAGDRVRVHFQVIEGTRRRTQVFEGIVIARQGSGARETFTVRKQSFGVGVERTFPVHSPKIERLEVVARGDVRRAKLYYLRGRVGKRARVAERRWGIEDDLVLAEATEPEAVDSEGVEPGGGRAGGR